MPAGRALLKMLDNIFFSALLFRRSLNNTVILLCIFSLTTELHFHGCTIYEYEYIYIYLL